MKPPCPVLLLSVALLADNVTSHTTSMVCVQTKTQILHEPVTVLSGVTIGNFAFWADSILVAALLYYGANSFKRVTEVKCDNQLPYIFQVGNLAS